MSRTAITCAGFQTKQALYTDIDLAFLMPDEDETFGVSLEHDDVACKPRIEVFDNRI